MRNVAGRRGATVRAGARDISAKAISYAEKNMQASLDYAQALLHAKDLSEVMRLHSEYVRSQMRSLAEQASEMGLAVSPRGDGCDQAQELGFLARTLRLSSHGSRRAKTRSSP
jgi:hypothetical protein